MKTSLLILALAMMTAIAAQTANARESFAYPAPNAVAKKRSVQPPWLVGGNGDDGYVTVTAEIEMPGLSCKELGNEGGLFKIGQEKVQIVVSLTTKGFKNSLDGQEIPLATFDGRTNPGGCAVLSTMPLTVVPYARLEQFSDVDAGNLSLAIDVRSSTDTDLNLVGAFQLVLGTAAVFATGPAAATVSGLTATLAKPALSTAQAYVSSYLSNITPGQSKYGTDWPGIRSGIETITVPVYIAKTAHGETTAQAIKRLQTSKESGGDKLFDVVLRFAYTQSLFDRRATAKDSVPSRDSVAPITVLNYPRAPGIPNFLQLVNSAAPSLIPALSSANKNDLSRACGEAINALDRAGIALLDRGITTKAIVDDAKRGPGWYKPDNIDSCFQNYPEVGTKVRKVFGTSAVPFAIGDMVIWDVTEDSEKFKKWADSVVPVMSVFRDAMEVSEDRSVALRDMNGGDDIAVELYAGASSWEPVQANQLGSENKNSIGIARLTTKKIVAGGCFVWSPSAVREGHMVLVEDGGKLWHITLVTKDGASGRLEKVRISPLREDWRTYITSNSFPGGECKSIRADYAL